MQKFFLLTIVFLCGYTFAQNNLAEFLKASTSIETKFVKKHDFVGAMQEYAKHGKATKNPQIQKRARMSIQRLKPLATLKSYLVYKISKEQPKIEIKFKGEKAQVIDATDSYYEVQWSKGKFKKKWKSLSPKRMYWFFRKIKENQHQFTIAIFCFMHELEKEGHSHLIKFYKASPQNHNLVNSFLASKLRSPIPKGGFPIVNGKFVSPKEKAMQEKGLVKYQGKWVTAEEKEKRERGLSFVNGKWVKATVEQLRKRNYEYIGNQWVSPKKAKALRQNWANAWQKMTKHYYIRCNVSKEMTEEVASILDQAYGKYQGFFGGKLAKQRMNIYVFKSFADYFAEVKKRGLEARVSQQFLGFAVIQTREAFVYVKSDSEEDRREFFSTLLHEAAHLFSFPVDYSWIICLAHGRYCNSI